MIKIDIEIEGGNERHFDIVARNQDNFEIGRLEADYFADGPPYIDRFRIGSCFVEPGSRGHRVGSKMVERALKEAIRRYPNATLAFVDVYWPYHNETFSQKERLAFWKANDFQEVKEVPGWEAKGQIMQRQLS